MKPTEINSEPGDQGQLLLREALQYDLLTSLIRQLNKDFELSGVEGSISEKATPAEIARELPQMIGKLIRADFQGFLNLLYRVDVSESGLHKTDNQDMDEFIAAASYQLLKREWQKVWLRNKIR
jgi:hypothetical protein